MIRFSPLIAATLLCPSLFAAELHVSPSGNDQNPGTKESPFRTIQHAAGTARPGDVVTVHAGTYRERIDPPRGGESDENRIVYQAAPGDKVVIKGSEPVKGWEKVEHDTWKVALPNNFFGGFNPYADEIRGDWFQPKGRKHHTGAVYRDGHWLVEAAKKEDVMKAADGQALWFGEVDETTTTLWAQFPGIDPNQQNIEINVRQAVFYPGGTGRNFITVRGFTMEQAATPWAPPTAEQIGLLGTNWSKGWIIENNTIRYSTCTGVTLGKHGDEFDNKSQNSAEGYVETIQRGLAAGWSKEKIGSHVVRNNHIHDCEQAGIVGSLGAAFSLITGNEIHDIHVRRLFDGAEQGGIKLHGAIDTIIRHNHVYRTGRGIWLDWMAQGTRVTGNLLHDNGYTEDLFLEVNHGPLLVDNNLFLSGNVLNDRSHGCAFAHNLMVGRLAPRPDNRKTPHHKAHSTEIAGLHDFPGGDQRFHNNLFVSPSSPPPWPARSPKGHDKQPYSGLKAYETTGFPNQMSGNVFFGESEPSKQEVNPLVLREADLAIKLVLENGAWFLEMKPDTAWTRHRTQWVTTDLLGKAKVPDLPYVQPDGTPYRIDTDYFGAHRKGGHAVPGPFAQPAAGSLKLKVWPLEAAGG